MNTLFLSFLAPSFPSHSFLSLSFLPYVWFVLGFLFVFFETRFHVVVLAGLYQFCLSLPCAEITGVSHYAQLSVALMSTKECGLLERMGAVLSPVPAVHK